MVYLPGGGAEQDPGLWVSAMADASRAIMEKTGVPASAVEAVCVSSTFSSTVAVDENGEAIGPALTWMDGRAAPRVRKLMGGFPAVLGYGLANLLAWVPKTGGGPSLSGKDDAAHVLFWKFDRPEVYERAAYFLSSKDYLNLKLCGRVAATYDSMALFWVLDIRDIRNVRYDPGLMRRMGIEPKKLPPLVASTELLGNLLPSMAGAMGLSPKTKVAAGSPDHQSAAVGAGAVRDFDAHLYIGTSSWLQCPVPFKKTDALHSIASLPFSVPGKYYAANEQDMAGGAFAWLAGLLETGPAEAKGQGISFTALDGLAGGVPAGSGGLLFFPWLNGERTPVDDPALGGAFFNLSKTTTRAHLARAVLEGVAFNTRWLLHYMERFAGRRLEPISFVGGGARSAAWCRILADVLNRTVRQVEDPMEANARGAAFIAAAALGRIRFEDVPGLVRFDAEYSPGPENRRCYDALYETFLDFYRTNKKMFHRLNRPGQW
jgi:xylulokinase